VAFSFLRADLQLLSAECVSLKVCKGSKIEGEDEVDAAAAAAAAEEDVLVEVDGDVMVGFAAGWAGSWALLPSVGVAGDDAEDGL